MKNEITSWKACQCSSAPERRSFLPPGYLKRHDLVWPSHTHVLRLLFLTVQSSFQGAMSWLVYNVLVATIFFTFDVIIFKCVFKCNIINYACVGPLPHLGCCWNPTYLKIYPQFTRIRSSLEDDVLVLGLELTCVAHIVTSVVSAALSSKDSAIDATHWVGGISKPSLRELHCLTDNGKCLKFLIFFNPIQKVCSFSGHSWPVEWIYYMLVVGHSTGPYLGECS